MLTEAGPGTTRDFATQFVFDALENARIPYALLRGSDELHQAGQNVEIGILVMKIHIDRMAGQLERHGFYELPAWGHAPHRFFVCFSREFGHWIKLDVVSDLYYGRPIRKYHIDLAVECLRDRRKEEVFLLSATHELVTTLLHCLLDKGYFHAKRKQNFARCIQQKDQIRIRARRIKKKISQPFQPGFFAFLNP